MTYRRVLQFWLPLFLAWLLMTVESAWIQGVISRKPDSETQLAAFGLLFSLSILIETPVIMLLATSSALSRDRQSFRILWRFMMAIAFFVTVVATLMAFTPLLDLYLGGLLTIPQHIIEATRPGMQIMILWSGLIAYRRFHQGIIIRFGKTRYIGYGTMVRVCFSCGVSLGLGVVTQLAGSVIGAFALVMAVAAEAAFTYGVSRVDVNELLKTQRIKSLPDLTYRAATRFHLPLAATSMVTLLIRPVIERGLAGMPDASQSLAAWPVIFSIILVLISGGMAYQEVVISLNTSSEHHRILRGFTWRLGLAMSVVMLLFVFTPLIHVYINILLNVPENLRELILVGSQASILLPLLTTLQSYLRALLILSHKTGTIYLAIILGFSVTTVILVAGIAAGIHGILAAALGLTIGQFFELTFLYANYRKQIPALSLHWRSFAASSACN